MEIDHSGLTSIRALGVPANRKDKTRPPTSVTEEPNQKSTSDIVIVRSGSEPVFQRADAFRQSAETLNQVGLKERNAIDAYESVAREEQRQKIHSMLGVDTFV